MLLLESCYSSYEMGFNYINAIILRLAIAIFCIQFKRQPMATCMTYVTVWKIVFPEALTLLALAFNIH